MIQNLPSQLNKQTNKLVNNYIKKKKKVQDSKFSITATF